MTDVVEENIFRGLQTIKSHEPDAGMLLPESFQCAQVK